MERTGHRSLAGVRAYKRTSAVQIDNCSAILDGRVMQDVAKKSRGSIPSAEKVNVQFFMTNCQVTINNVNDPN